MLVELTPTAYLALCGLVDDALMVESDASPILKRVKDELAGATAGSMFSSELLENPSTMDALRRSGYAA